MQSSFQANFGRHGPSPSLSQTYEICSALDFCFQWVQGGCPNRKAPLWPSWDIQYLHLASLRSWRENRLRSKSHFWQVKVQMLSPALKTIKRWRHAQRTFAVPIHRKQETPQALKRKCYKGIPVCASGRCYRPVCCGVLILTVQRRKRPESTEASPQ